MKLENSRTENAFKSLTDDLPAVVGKTISLFRVIVGINFQETCSVH